MDSFELNKVMGAVLGAMLLAMGLNIFSGIIYTPKRPAISGYDLPSPQPETAGAGGDQQAQAEPLPVLLASADAGRGQTAVKKCGSCHVFEKAGANKIGPALYGVMGRGKGAHEGFAYSSAMKSKGGEWSYDDMNKFLANPKGWMPGTIMAFAGVSSPKERADIMAYLKTMADTQLPFPVADASPAPPAGGAPGPAQNEQRPAPPAPGQRAEPGPAPKPAEPKR